MARWRLAAAHYLAVPGVEWEYKEVDRNTGRPKTVKFAVPLALDPNQPADWNIRHGDGTGEIVVCLEGKGLDRDIVFTGDPTPDMVPLDDEAKAISARFEQKWKHPIESLTGAYAEKVLDDLQKEVDEIRSRTAEAPAAGVAEVLTAMKDMMLQNQQLMQLMAQSLVKPSTEAPATPAARRA